MEKNIVTHAVDTVKRIAGISPADPVAAAEADLNRAVADLATLNNELALATADLVSHGEEEYDSGGVAAINNIGALDPLKHRINVLEGVIAKRRRGLEDARQKQRDDQIAAERAKIADRRTALADIDAAILAVATVAAGLSRLRNRGLQVQGLPTGLEATVATNSLGVRDPVVTDAENRLAALGIAPASHPFGASFIDASSVEAAALKKLPIIERALSKALGFDIAALRDQARAADPTPTPAQAEHARLAVEERRQECRRKLAKAAQEWPTGKKPDEIAGDVEAFDLGNTLLGACVERDIPVAALHSLLQRAGDVMAQHGGGVRSPTPRADLLVKLIGWEGALL